jgi:hypothetical protein
MTLHKIKHKSLKSLRKTLWKLVSEYVRRTENGVCFTCGDKRMWQAQDAGHYIHKNCLDYDLVNIHCQCSRCNRYLHGNSGVYAEKLIKLYGQATVENLRRKANITKKFSIIELETMISEYKLILKSLK